MGEERRHGERRTNLENGEACCAEVVKVSTTMKVIQKVIGGIVAFLLVCIPLGYSKLNGIETSLKTLEIEMAKMSAAQNFLAFRLTEHLTERK